VILGNLHDFKPENAVPVESLTLIDRWVLERLHDVTKVCVDAYAAFDFRKVFTAINQFCASDLSSLYIDITKDRMYCDPANGTKRRAAQTAFREIAETLTKLLAPILAFTADETWEHLGFTESVHLEVFPVPNPAHVGSDANVAVEEMVKARAAISQAIEPERQAKKIGSSLEATVRLTLPTEGYTHAVWNDAATLQEFFILSELEVVRGPELKAEVRESSNQKCARCWKHLPDVGSNAKHACLCGRCAEAVG